MPQLPLRTFVVIPVYFDAEAACVLLNELIAEWRHDGASLGELSVVVVDNTARRDGAAPSLAKLSAEGVSIEVIHTSYQSGHQHAILYGLNAVAAQSRPGDVVVTMDGDGEDAPRDAVRMAHHLLDGDLSLVLASRGQRHSALPFRIGYAFYRATYRCLTGVSIRTGNFAAMTYPTLWEITANPVFVVSYSGALPTIPGASMLRCERDPRTAGESRMNRTSLIAHGLTALIPQAPRIASRMFVLFFMALFLAVVGVVSAALLRSLGDVVAPGWATTLVIGMGLVAAIAFLGFLAGLILLAILQVLRRPLPEPPRER